MNYRILTIAIGAVVLSGCAATGAVKQTNEAVQEATMDRMEALKSPVQETQAFSYEEDGFFAARRPLSVTPINPSMQLPKIFQEQFELGQQMPMSLSEFATAISGKTGIRMIITPDVLEGQTGGGSTPAAAPAAAGAGAPPSALPGGLPPLPTALPMPVSVSSGGSGSGMPMLPDFLYRGTLQGALDEMATRLNLSWRWTGDRIEVYRFDTKMFRLHALSGKISSSATLNTTSSGSSGGSGGGSSGGGTQGSSGSDTSMDIEMEIWKEVEENIESLLSENGKMSVAPSAGTITVKDTPAVLRQVEAQMKEFNRIYSRQVTLQVDVFAVDINQGDDYAFNWNVFWSSAGQRLNFSSSAVGAATGTSAPTYRIGVRGGPFNNSSVVFRALSTLGNTSLVTQGTAVTMNGQTVPLNVSREINYLASSSTNISSGIDGIATTTLTPGVVTEGFSMQFTPMVLDNNEVRIRYSIDLSVLERLDPITSETGAVALQLPSRSVRNFLQNVSVRSGESMVLTGFQQVQGSDQKQGPLSPSAWLLGGSQNMQSGTRNIVIVITPYVMDN